LFDSVVVHLATISRVFSFLSRLLGRSDPAPWTAICESCGGKFEYTLIHNGFAETAHAYCDRCGATALLSGWYEHVPAGAPLRVQGSIELETEPWLSLCSCGGTFRRNASPRCPHCVSPLSAELATRHIEKNAPGAKRGWRWQRTWVGVYAMIIERRIVNDNWRQQPPGESRL
jgi:predicted amidophosphoribosyltransferase